MIFGDILYQSARNGDGIVHEKNRLECRLLATSRHTVARNRSPLYPQQETFAIAGTPCLLEITWLREVAVYHGVIRRLADTMVKVSQNAAGTAVV